MSWRAKRPVAEPVPRFGEDRDATVRVVVEIPDPGDRWVASKLLTEAGYEVVSCGGPSDLDQRCPIELGEGCPAIADADVVVSSLRADVVRHGGILAGVRARYPDTPLIVEAPAMVAAAHPDVLAGCEVVFPFTAETLRTRIDAVLARV
jgi:hypothetical protein